MGLFKSLFSPNSSSATPRSTSANQMFEDFLFANAAAFSDAEQRDALSQLALDDGAGDAGPSRGSIGRLTDGRLADAEAGARGVRSVA